MCCTNSSPLTFRPSVIRLRLKIPSARFVERFLVNFFVSQDPNHAISPQSVPLVLSTLGDWDKPSIFPLWEQACFEIDPDHFLRNIPYWQFTTIHSYFGAPKRIFFKLFCGIYANLI